MAAGFCVLSVLRVSACGENEGESGGRQLAFRVQSYKPSYSGIFIYLLHILQSAYFMLYNSNIVN